MPDLQFNLEDRSPFNKHFIIAKNARLPDLIVQLLDGTTAVNLTGAAVKFSMDDEAGVAKVDAVAAVLDDATNGKVKYQWGATDTDTEGVFLGQFIITISSQDYRIPNNNDQKLIIEIGSRVN